MKRIIIVLFSLLLICSFCFSVQAAEAIDLTREGTLDVFFSMDDGTDITGMQFDLYRVADVLQDGETQLCSAFASLNMEIPLAPADAWAQITNKAATIVRRSALSPLQSVRLQSTGVAHFPESGKHLTAGIYLIYPRTMVSGDREIGGNPTLVALPLEDNGWNYHVQVSPKGGAISPEDYLDVVVVWDDQGFEATRPEYVWIDLYCDDVLVDSQQVNADMQWQYHWKPAPVWSSPGQNASGPGSDVTIHTKHSWYVTQRTEDGYQTTYALGGNRRFVVTNTIYADPPSSPDDKLPQTGVLWWPVPVLVLAGFCMLFLSRIVVKKERKYE